MLTESLGCIRHANIAMPPKSGSGPAIRGSCASNLPPKVKVNRVGADGAAIFEGAPVERQDNARLKLLMSSKGECK